MAPPSPARLSSRLIRRHRVVRTLMAACVLLAAWIVVLAVRLPKRYSAPHWDLAWVGFDVALLVFLVATAWAAWHRRAVIILFATVTATLLFADAWFDVTTARSSEMWLSIAEALVVELPFAIFLLYVSVTIIGATRGVLWEDATRGADRVALWSVQFSRPSDPPGGDVGASEPGTGRPSSG